MQQHPTQNGADYVKFRGYSLGNTLVNGSSFGQPKHSYYFYFGILPGKTALEVMNQRFFTVCNTKTDSEFIIQVTTTETTTSGSTDGTATFTFVGGDAPYTATTSGPNGYTNVIVVGQNNTQPTTTLTNLPIGIYTITGYDAIGQPVVQTFTISGPPALYADAYVSQDCTTAAAADGQITIAALGGGQGTKTVRLYNSNCALVSGPTTVVSVPFVIPTGLPTDNGVNTCYQPSGHGYTIVVTDTAGSQVIVNDLVVSGPTPITLTPNVTQILCYGAATGCINITIAGGQQPYSVVTTSPNGYINNNSLIMNNLSAGTYTTTVTDSLGTQVSTTNTLSYMNPLLGIQTDTPQMLKQQCDPNNYHINLFVTSPWAGSTVYLDYVVDQQEDNNGNLLWQPITLNGYVNSTTPIQLVLPSTAFQEDIVIRMTNAAKTCYSESVEIGVTDVMLPITTLSINTTNVNNTKQCVPNQIKFKFNISHLTMGSTIRAPYTVTYTVTGINEFGQLVSSQMTTTVTTNQQEITANVPKPNNVPASSCVVTVSVKDNVECVSNTIQIPITLPTVLLTGSWGADPNNPAPYQFNGQTYLHKVLNASGGIGPYTATPYQIYNGNPNNVYNFPQSVVLSSTVTDSVGCSIIVNG